MAAATTSLYLPQHWTQQPTDHRNLESPCLSNTPGLTSPLRSLSLSQPNGLLNSPHLPNPFSLHQPPPSPSPSPSPLKQTTTAPLPVKRTRRKRCGQCPGCLKADNCGRCVVCTNPNTTNSVCKERRCDLLTQRPVS